MIAYLPEIYPDELVYSWFCRYYVHSGCLTHKTALQEILYSQYNTPSKEFLGHLNPEISALIQENYPIESIVIDNTMFPQYARFIPLEQKRKALYHIIHNIGDAQYLVSILPREGDDKYMKYCPICANEDRKRYGETYWHRVHQIRNMQICTKHNCKLVNSAVIAKSGQTFTFCPAESFAIQQQPIIETNHLKIVFANYMTNVFNAPMDFEKDVPISAVLYHRMLNSQYTKPTSKIKYLKQLSEDMYAYYSKIDLEDMASVHQIRRVLFGECFNFSVICQIAFLLKMNINDLTNPTLTTEQINQEQNTHYRKDKTPIDWTAYDGEMAPILEQLARSVYDGSASETGRPERVSQKMIYEKLGLSKYRIEIMPKCRTIMERYDETYEENWARRIVWAYNKLNSKNIPFCWSDIKTVAGVQKKSINAIIPYIIKYTNKETADKIIQMIK